MRRRRKLINKQQIISDYLTGDSSFNELSDKYGVNARTIQSWVRAYRKSKPISIPGPDVISDDQLKKRLEQAELKNALLEEMLRLSEELTGIDLRKKFGNMQ